MQMIQSESSRIYSEILPLRWTQADASAINGNGIIVGMEKDAKASQENSLFKNSKGGN